MPDEAREDDPGWLLATLVDTVPHARSAVLLSSDGLPITSHGLDDEYAVKLSVQASAICSIARNVAVVFSGKGGIRQVVAEMDDLMLFVSSAGFGSVLAVLAGRQADAGVVGYEMSQFVKSVAPFLASRPRIRGTRTRQTVPELPQRVPPEGPG